MSDDKEQRDLAPWPRETTWGRDMHEWGGAGRDGVVRVASALWGVFQSTEEGPPLVTGMTEDEAMAAFAEQVAAEFPEMEDPEAFAEQAISLGEVFCRPCVVAYAFANSAEVLEPSPTWISGEDVRAAVEAERERGAKLLDAHAARLEQEMSRYRKSLNEHSDMEWANEYLNSIALRLSPIKSCAAEIRRDPNEPSSKP